MYMRKPQKVPGTVELKAKVCFPEKKFFFEICAQFIFLVSIFHEVFDDASQAQISRSFAL